VTSQGIECLDFWGVGGNGYRVLTARHLPGIEDEVGGSPERRPAGSEW